MNPKRIIVCIFLIFILYLFLRWLNVKTIEGLGLGPGSGIGPGRGLGPGSGLGRGIYGRGIYVGNNLGGGYFYGPPQNPAYIYDIDNNYYPYWYRFTRF